MPEGINFVEAHAEVLEEEHLHASGHGAEHGGKWGQHLAVAEALVLSLVTITVAWSGFAAAKWNTESQFILSQSALTGVEASRTDLEAQSLRDFDSLTFDAWFTAYILDNKEKMAMAKNRFRPVMRTAFDAWMKTNPETNPTAPAGPTFMADYKLPEEADAKALTAEASRLHEEGLDAGRIGDDYVRSTVVLAGVLFLTGIGRTFPMASVRTGLLSVGVGLLAYSLFLILQLPALPA